MSTPETLCSGCGATVKQMGNGLWFDLEGFIICEKGDADDCHYVNPALPSVAIAPEPQHTPECISIGNTEIRKLSSGEWPEVFLHVGHKDNRGNCVATVCMGGAGATSRDVKDVLATAEKIVNAYNSHDDMLAALKAYDAEIVKLTDQQLIDNPGLMTAVVNGRSIVSRAEGGKQ